MKIPFDVKKYKSGAKACCRSFFFTPRNIEIHDKYIRADVGTSNVSYNYKFYTDGRFWRDCNMAFDLMIEE